MEWTCLDWNKPSLDFYQSLGAHPKEGCVAFRLEGDALNKLAE